MLTCIIILLIVSSNICEMIYLLISFNSVHFELKHNVCGRRVYAEGTTDAVEFIYHVSKSKPAKRLYNMIDVLESGSMR